VGSVFSPYYYWALQKNPAASPEDHCAINVALYGRGIRRWTMTERGQRHVSRDSRNFQVGPSHLRWTGAHLEIQINEWSAPIPRPVRGVIRVIPNRLFAFTTALDDGHLHHWGPLAPSARVEVALESPKCSWQGHAYLDSNEGASPIADGFTEWDWSRANLSDGSVAVLYDIRQRQGPDRLLALRFGRDGQVSPFDAPARQSLPMAMWRVGRSVRSESARPARVMQTLEDTPFYVRSVLESGLCGEQVISMHETLNVPRLNTAMTRLMLPWKMPRLK
jgi:carotenoid 1,2-hydratase